MKKRFLDLLLIFLFLPILLFVLVLIFILVWFNMGTPVFYSQLRPGLNGKIFKMYKFRTMNNDKDAEGNLLDAQLRITKFGRFLRSSSLDELPELYNILKGEMSLVGPRPLRVEYLPVYNDYQSQRHNAKPGITGWAQVNGRNAISWDEKFDFDVHYVKNVSLMFDLKILFFTLVKILKREGINSSDDKLIKPFCNVKLNG